MDVLNRLYNSKAARIGGLLLLVGLIGYGAWVCTRPGPAPPVIDTYSLTVYFPRQPSEPPDTLDADPSGRLVLDEDGCLHLDEDGPLIIWPHSGYAVDIVDDEVALVDDETGDLIARVGDEVALHGGNSDEAHSDYLERPLPEACADADLFLPTASVRRADET